MVVDLERIAWLLNRMEIAMQRGGAVAFVENLNTFDTGTLTEFDVIAYSTRVMDRGGAVLKH